MTAVSGTLYRLYANLLRSRAGVPNTKRSRMHSARSAQKMQRSLSQLYLYTTATVQTAFGLKQGRPLSPLLVYIYLDTIDSVLL